MEKQKVFIIGSSGHAKVIINIFEEENKYEIAGLIDSHKKIGDETSGYKILGREKDLPPLMQDNNASLFIAIGDNYTRYKVYKRLLDIVPNAQYASAVHPSAQIAKEVEIGSGVAVMGATVINSQTVIEDFAIVNTKASIDHDSHIHKFASIAPGVTMGGNVTIGEFTAVSLGANIIHSIKVGNHTVVGAGSLVLGDIGDNVVVVGVPAKEIRKREIGEKYL